MPRGRRQKHFKDEEVPDGFEENERVTKCSLSSLCHPGVRDVRRFLEEAIQYCSKLRVVTSQVAKHHIFATGRDGRADSRDRQRYRLFSCLVLACHVDGLWMGFADKDSGPRHAASQWGEDVEKQRNLYRCPRLG